MIQNRKKTRTNIAVLIPAYNEAASIARVVSGVLQNRNIAKCVVVDDGSIDHTGVNARKAGAYVLRMSKNSGAGAALRAGLAAIVKSKVDYIITLDADGQHDPVYIPRLLNGISQNNEFVIASRYIKQTPNSTQYLRRFATKIISMAIEKAYSVKVSDPTSGFRIMTKRVAQLLSGAYPTRFSEPEIILLLIKNHIQFSEISIPMSPRLYGRSSISFLRGTLMFAYILIKIMKSSLVKVVV